MSGWSPNIFLSEEEFKEIDCSGKNMSPISIGYAQSYNIVDSLSKKYSEDIFKKTYEKIKEENITMSSNHEILNNQMNYVLTLSSGEDTTAFLNSFGLNVSKVNPEDEESLNSILTGMDVFDEEDKEYSIIKIILFVIILAIIILIAKRIKKSKRFKKYIR